MEAGRKRSAPDVLEALALFAGLFAFWLALSNRYEASELAMGAASAGLVALVTHERLFRSGRAGRQVGRALRRVSPLGLLRYAGWLLGEIVQANLQVAWIVIHPRMPVAPRLLRFRVGFEEHLPQVVLAHSITLTPGTVTIDLREGVYLVHALVPSSADALLSGRMQSGVAKAFGGALEESPQLEWLRSVRDAAHSPERGAE